jgi:predicted AAA+ superfamily ATPase
MLPRHLESHLIALLQHFPCVVVNGVRQSGKTVHCALAEFVSAHDFPLGLVINNDDKPRLLGERLVSVPAAAL